MKYTIVMAYTARGVEQTVANLIEQGYAPCGGLSVVWTQGDASPHFYQAMVRS